MMIQVERDLKIICHAILELFANSGRVAATRR
jgi:hypothetical protein